MDYEVFLLSRIEEHDAGAEHETAVEFGPTQRSTRIITAAAVTLLAIVFTSFITSSSTVDSSASASRSRSSLMRPSCMDFMVPGVHALRQPR